MPFDEYVLQYELNKRTDVKNAFEGLSFSASCRCGFDGRCSCKKLSDWSDLDELCSSVSLVNLLDVLGSMAELVYLHVYEPTGVTPVQIQQLRHLYFSISLLVEKLAV